jgi:hypothetical protein
MPPLASSALIEKVLIIRAVFFASACCAMPAHPDTVELVHDLSDQLRIGRDEPRLEIPVVNALGAHACAGKIGAAAVGEPSVDHHRLEMDARAEDPLHPVDQSGKTVEIPLKRRARFLCVQQPDRHPCGGKIGEEFEKGDHVPPLMDVKVLEVGGRKPEEPGALRDRFEYDLLVYLAVGDEGDVFHGGPAPAFTPSPDGSDKALGRV